MTCVKKKSKLLHYDKYFIERLEGKNVRGLCRAERKSKSGYLKDLQYFQNEKLFNLSKEYAHKAILALVKKLKVDLIEMGKVMCSRNPDLAIGETIKGILRRIVYPYNRQA